MTPNAPDPDTGVHVREQVRRIIADEDLACLGVKARAPIPASEEERVALATLRYLNGACLEPQTSKSPATREAPEHPRPGSHGSSGSAQGSSEPSE